MENAIIAENLTFKYGNLLAVDHINIEVKKGEIVGFLGPNGAGKTTTFKMLIGLLKPLEGSAYIFGMDVRKEAKNIQKQIGVSFEYTNLYEELSCEENLKIFAELFGIKDLNTKELLKRVGLEGKEKAIVSTLSKGMKQRVMIARALVNNPKILFLDEPTSGLDPVSANEIREIIKEERKKGVTVFLTTHDMYEADKLSDRVAFINQGRIVAFDTPLNLKQRYGKRKVKVQILKDNRIKEEEIELDSNETLQKIQEIFKNEKIITIHSEEATLEDIFIKITGRGLL